jgi:hypothetical protein
MDWSPIPHRLRCNGHIINLIAQAFLFPKSNLEALLIENNMSVSMLALPTEVEVIQWRNKGPLRKLHNIEVYIQRSP